MEEQQIARIKEVLETIKPFVHGDGGNIEFVKYEDGVVYVRLEGACITCPSSFYTLQFGIENALKEKMSEVREVVAVVE